MTNSYFNQEWIFSLCCPAEAKEIRSSPGSENSRTRVSNADHCNGHFLLFLLSKDPRPPSQCSHPIFRCIFIQSSRTDAGPALHLAGDKSYSVSAGTRDSQGCSCSSRFQVRKLSFQHYWICVSNCRLAKRIQSQPGKYFTVRDSEVPLTLHFKKDLAVMFHKRGPITGLWKWLWVYTAGKLRPLQGVSRWSVTYPKSLRKWKKRGSEFSPRHLRGLREAEAFRSQVREAEQQRPLLLQGNSGSHGNHSWKEPSLSPAGESPVTAEIQSSWPVCCSPKRSIKQQIKQPCLKPPQTQPEVCLQRTHGCWPLRFWLWFSLISWLERVEQSNRWTVKAEVTPGNIMRCKLLTQGFPISGPSSTACFSDSSPSDLIFQNSLLNDVPPEMASEGKHYLIWLMELLEAVF